MFLPSQPTPLQWVAVHEWTETAEEEKGFRRHLLDDIFTSLCSGIRNTSMALHRLFQLSSLIRSAVSVTLRRNIGISAVLFTRAKDMDPVQKLFLDKIRDYTNKSKAAGGVVDAGPAYQKTVTEEVTKLQRLYGGGDLTKFPDFKFTDPKLDEVAK
ncbi:ATP synthase-coupling factor 6, mitochondrial [Sardina pilchardus]|uniref:ATP synthase-coupling factor 6, mitochondrial n=1 Tax=Sardina pilchardus TaxID=27697 RepID=UPI002E0F26F0